MSNSQTEKLSFQAEVKQLLHLVTHSLYSNKEIFLRELISNASDAADKLRFLALSDDALYEGDSKLCIRVSFDKDARTITVRDNGIGMSREEVISNLGTIAKSGTKEFLESLTGDQTKDANLIGQFGVGFYSSFVVADKVTVTTRRAGMLPNQGVYWESTADGEYIIKNIDQPWRGTEVTLHLKPEEDEFLDNWRLRNIITKCSDHIILPIYLQKPVDKKEDKEAKEAKKEKEEKDVEASKETKEEESVNRATALWTLPKKDIKDEDYKELYKHITHDFTDPLLWSHNIVEGKLEYITLLYIPEHAPFDMQNREGRHGLKLYVQRVFIMDNAEQLLPSYLRFVRGIVDSKDLPLNVSREILQNNKVIESMRSGIIKRILEILEKLSQEDTAKYTKFWHAFGQVLKEGIVEDSSNKDRIAKLLRLSSTYTGSNDTYGDVSLDDYIGRMKAGQEKIYYITAESLIAAKNSPYLEIFKKKDIEVLLLVHRIDEWLVSDLHEYAGKKLQSVAKGDIDLSKMDVSSEKSAEDDKKTEEDQNSGNSLEDVIKKMKKILTDKVKDIRCSKRLIDFPSCVIMGEYDMSLYLQRMMMAAGQSNLPREKPILELNPEHPLVLHLKNEADEEKFTEWTNLLFEQALLAEGGRLDDPASFVKRFNSVLLSNLKS